MSVSRTLLLATTLLVAPTSLSAQTATPTADPTDVESVEAVMTAIYEVISGPAGEARDWDRFRSLFVEGARLIPTGGPDAQGRFGHQVLTPEDFIEGSAAALEEQGFFERETHRITERYGPVVHAFSTYESRRHANDVEPFARGINSFQLLHDGERWWVVTIFWHGETPQTPIPERYLSGG